MATSQAFRNALHIPTANPASAGSVVTADTATANYASSWQLGAQAGGGAPFYVGSGPPVDATGIQGSFYIDSANDAIYGPKASGAPFWPVALSMTASEILTKLSAIDGDGSGLDADYLDGQSSAVFLDLSAHTGAIDVGTF